MNLRNWFAQVWPFPTGKSAVRAGYLALRSHRHLLADIAMRNYVLGEAPAGDAISLAIAEGRRRAALEIIKLANLDPTALWDVIEAKPQQEKTK